MKLKNARILYDSNMDAIALVEFNNNAPISADDRTSEFTAAMIKFLTLPQKFKGHFYRAWILKIKTWLNMSIKSTRHIVDNRGNSYTIIVKHKKIKVPAQQKTEAPTKPSTEQENA